MSPALYCAKAPTEDSTIAAITNNFFITLSIYKFKTVNILVAFEIVCYYKAENEVAIYHALPSSFGCKDRIFYNRVQTN